MREIKFRAWDIDRKEMYFPTSLHCEYRGDQNFQTRRYVGDDVSILMQYTGLKDKNGKEIYEGDILDSSIRSIVCRGVMEWNEDRAAWSTFHPISKFEVIGNIYQNPELLKT